MRQFHAVNKVLSMLEVHSYPSIAVLNKIDKLAYKLPVSFVSRIFNEYVFCSALFKRGIEELRKKIKEKIFSS
jgi:50S ribosomal subunit-associated GTPase HflX